MFDNPQEFKFYNIVFQHIEYTVLAEVLFALIINEFKEQIEKDFIIEQTEIELPIINKILNSRIATALDAIGFKDIQ